MDQGCPCGRTGSFGAVAYSHCCGRYLEPTSPQHLQAPDAEHLMRSRYTAFERGAGDYLLATWAPEHRPTHRDLDAGLTWLGLQVLSHEPDGDRANVEFVARFRDGVPRGDAQAIQNPVRQLHERSRFARRDGHWLYLDGNQLG